MSLYYDNAELYCTLGFLIWIIGGYTFIFYFFPVTGGTDPADDWSPTAEPETTDRPDTILEYTLACVLRRLRFALTFLLPSIGDPFWGTSF